jgi:Ran GTPase-activating protein (RanGAP) involved in mRNA processing and transport
LNTAWSPLKTEGAYSTGNAMRYMPHLNYIDLKASMIGPLGAVNLAVNIIYCAGNIKNLNLALNKIGPKAIRCIAISLSFMENLSILDLSGNMIEDEGAEHLSQTIRYLKMLSYLEVSSNDLTELGKKLIEDTKPDSKCYLEIMY